MHPGIITLNIVLITLVMTFLGLRQFSVLTAFNLNVGQILYFKKYYRLFTCGFLHVDWKHFFFNMIMFVCFGSYLESTVTSVQYLIFYFASLLAGSGLAVIMNRKFSEYNAVGASAAVCGVVFSTITLRPDITTSLYGIISFPAWVFAVLYFGYTIYGIIKKHDHIGHEAHLAGGVFGMVLTICFYPEVLSENSAIIACVMIPVSIFTIFSLTKSNLFSEVPINIFSTSGPKVTVVQKSKIEKKLTPKNIKRSKGEHAPSINDQDAPTR